MDVDMLRKMLLAFVVLNAAPIAYAQSTLDGFAFPEFNDTQSNQAAEVESSDRPSPVVAAPVVIPDATAVGSAVKSLPPTEQFTGTQIEATSENTARYKSRLQNFTSYNRLSGQLPLHSVGYASFGPSAPSPLLAYMQCDQNSCPNVWQGFAAQHQRDQAAYCSPKGCNHCGSCGCNHGIYNEACLTGCATGGCGHKLRNRYTEPACDSCQGH